MLVKCLVGSATQALIVALMNVMEMACVSKSPDGLNVILKSFRYSKGMQLMNVNASNSKGEVENMSHV